jgi:hypothetical protein
MRILAGTVFALFLAAGPAVAEDWNEYNYPAWRSNFPPSPKQ